MEIAAKQEEWKQFFEVAGYSIDRVDLENKWRVTASMKYKAILLLLETIFRWRAS